MSLLCDFWDLPDHLAWNQVLWFMSLRWSSNIHFILPLFLTAFSPLILPLICTLGTNYSGQFALQFIHPLGCGRKLGKTQAVCFHTERVAGAVRQLFCDLCQTLIFVAEFFGLSYPTRHSLNFGSTAQNANSPFPCAIYICLSMKLHLQSEQKCVFV